MRPWWLLLLCAGCQLAFNVPAFDKGAVPGYAFRKSVDLVPPNRAALDDFPVLLSAAADPDLAAHALASGRDLVVADEHGTILPYDVERYDDATGAYAIWVRVPELYVETKLFLYYGGPARPPDTAVWKDYAAVWHLGDASGSRAEDSSPNNNLLGQAMPAAQPRVMPGIAGNAQRFDGAQFLIAQNPGTGSLAPGVTSFSYSAWVFVDDLPAAGSYYGPFYNGGSSSPDPGFDLEIAGGWGASVSDGVANTEVDSAAVGVVGKWNHIVVVVERGVDVVSYYLNGLRGASVTLGSHGALDHKGDFRIGSLSGFGELKGLVDEVRVYSTTLTEEWIATEYANLAAPVLFPITVGAEQKL